MGLSSQSTLIIAYIIWAKQSEDGNTAPTVRMTGKRPHTTASVILRSHGEETGMGDGVKSGTAESICQPKTHSSTVRIEGHYAVRHQDEWWMNNKNTIGKMQWIVEPSVPSEMPPLKGGNDGDKENETVAEAKNLSNFYYNVADTSAPASVNSMNVVRSAQTTQMTRFTPLLSSSLPIKH